MESRRMRSRSQALKWACYAAALFVCAALQTTPGLFRLGQAKPLFILPLCLAVAVYEGEFAGALFGFLWYNCYPAQVFMGDTGSLAIGGIIAVFALLIRKELLLPILCGIFFIESLSVIMQVTYFKYTKKRYGEGRRIFLMSPLHHHFQKKGYFESKIVVRFWIVQLLLAAITLVTLKIR